MAVVLLVAEIDMEKHREVVASLGQRYYYSQGPVREHVLCSTQRVERCGV